MQQNKLMRDPIKAYSLWTQLYQGHLRDAETSEDIKQAIYQIELFIASQIKVEMVEEDTNNAQSIV